MHDTMDALGAGLNEAPGDDLSALAWVHGELRRSLETAHKALRRYLKESDSLGASDVDAVDPAVLRGARNHLHQGVGALELVGLPAVADVLRASELAVQRMSAKPALVNLAAIETVERVSFALLDYLARMLAGKPVSPVALFPQYEAALKLAGADRVHPADLWKTDWQWRELPSDLTASPRQTDDEARGAMETLMLALMRQPDAKAARGIQARLSDFCADLGAGARQQPGGTRLATCWQLAAAVLEAQADGLLASDVFTKRLSSRLLAQMRMGMAGRLDPSDRLAQDLLFFCSHARQPGNELRAPRLAEVRHAWRLAGQPTADYQTPRLGRFDPAQLALAKKRAALAKDSWSAVAGGEQHRAAGMADQFSLVGDSLQKLLPSGDVLARALQAAVAQTVSGNNAPPPALAMEVATAILYLEASLEDGELEQPELGGRVQSLAARIDSVRGGAEPQPLDDWMEDLYRRVSDRQTIGSVVQELRASLSEVEKQIDQYFRNPAERQVLIPVPAQLSAMRGVLSVMGLDHASRAALHMRDEVDALAQTEVDPQRAIQTGTFDRLAHNLGALSFLIDMISVQPQMAKSLFHFDPDTGSLSAVMGQHERVSAFADLQAPSAPQATISAPPEPAAPGSLLEQVQSLAESAAQADMADAPLRDQIEHLTQQAVAAEQPDLARRLDRALATLDGGPEMRPALQDELGQALVSLAGAPPEPLPPQIPVPPSAPVPEGGTGLEEDAEMREIFIEEAREVVEDARAALERLADTPDNVSDMTAVRRAFHTLKGSSRMVGLRDFGEAAWSCEQLYNARLAHSPRIDGPLRQFTVEALDYLHGWTEAIAAAEDRGHQAAAVARSADALRLNSDRLPLQAPAGPAAAVAAEGVLEAQAQPAATAANAPPAVLDGLLHLQVSDETDLPVLPEPPAALPAADDGPDLDLSPALPDLDSELEAEPLPAPTGSDELPAVDFDFGTVAPAAPEPALSLAALLERVPGLPSAADLDLGPPLFAPPASPSQADEPAFELDLSTFDDPAQARTAHDETGQASTALDLPLGLPDTPIEAAVPLPVPQALEIDLADLEAEFAAPTEVLSHEADAADLCAVDHDAEDAAPVEALRTPQTLLQPDAEAVAPTAELDEQVKVIGPLRISIPLFNIYLNEADELSRRLGVELAEWAVEHDRHPVPESSAALAHSLAGNSATVGYTDLSALARALEHALVRSHALGVGRPGEAELFSDAAEEIRRLLHQFAAGFLRDVPPELMQRLAEHELQMSAETPAAPEALADAAEADDALAEDVLDAELLPLFQEEAVELLPELQVHLRKWLDNPADAAAPAGCMRSLHTFKGGARVAGAMRLGEMAHRLETDVEALASRPAATSAEIEALLAQADAMEATFQALGRDAAAPAPAALAAPVATGPLRAEAVAAPDLPIAPVEPTAPFAELAEAQAALPALPALPLAEETAPELAAKPLPVIDWTRFAATEAAPPPPPAERTTSGAAAVRVRAGLLDRLVNQAGEVSITRARIDADVKTLQGNLVDLSDSLDRMRRQLRDLELQAETQISSRLEAAKVASQAFDPLEMDRFTRFQEITRFMAESVNDVATLQRSLQRTLQSTEDELAAQARLTRELQDDLLRTRMIEFDSLSDRLYRTVRQAAKETGKQARLEIAGGSIEIDRGVLERMIGPFEHLLRNCVAHGVEAPEARVAAGKDAGGLVSVSVAQAGNEVAVEFADDGAGLDLARIRSRALERGLLAADAQATDGELAQLIFQPGFSTSDTVTEIAGRGVGLDVVRAEVNAMGGRIETSSAPQAGTRFKLLLPLTTAVTQVVMLRCGTQQVAVPSTLIELVRRVSADDVRSGYETGLHEFDGERLPFFWLSSLLGEPAHTATDDDPAQTVVVIRSATQRVAVHVDEVVGNQEVVVKNVGPQLARLPGLAGVTLLPSGSVALIYNPVALAAVYGERAHALSDPQVRLGAPQAAAAPAPLRAPLVMVVDDSLTVRRVTQRMLVREGYRVVTAKDGLDALEKLAEERPKVLLSDIEMPRMDGFDLVRNVRADVRLAGLPVIMITSRIAQKHRDYAAELGVQHYLGKPYSEEEVLALVARYAGARNA